MQFFPLFLFFQKQSSYNGVQRDQSNKKWQARMMINGKWTYLGCSKNEEECAKIINHKFVKLGLEKRFPELLECLKPPERPKAEVTEIMELLY